MPLPCPAGALPAAYRLLCLRCVRRQISNGEHTCSFDKSTSKKCTYCTAQSAVCVPLPWFVDTEFGTYTQASTPAEVSAAAAAIEEICRVAASEAPRSSAELQFGLMEESRALRALVGSLTETVSVLAAEVSSLLRESGKGASRKRLGGVSGGGREKRRRVREERVEEGFVPSYVGDTVKEEE